MSCKTKKYKKMAMGGQIGSALGTAVGSAANFIVPGLGSILSPILGNIGNLLGGKVDAKKTMREQLSQSTVNTNPYGFEDGGLLTGKDDLSFYKGRSHRTGGIKVNTKGIPTYNPTAEVEGGESRVRIGNHGYIFSKKLKI